MKINVKHILQGIKNSVFVTEKVEEIARERYEVCKKCPAASFNQNNPDITPAPGAYYSTVRPDEHCTHCACNLHAKVRSLQTSCPIEKWKAVATIQQAAKIAAVLDKDSNPKS